MTPVDETQQNEDANLRKVVAQLRDLSNDAWARAIKTTISHKRITEHRVAEELFFSK